MNILDLPPYPPAGKGQGWFGAGSKCDQHARGQVVDKPAQLAVNAVAGDLVVVVQHQEPGGVVLAQGVDQTGDGGGLVLVVTAGELFADVFQPHQTCVFKGDRKSVV